MPHNAEQKIKLLVLYELLCELTDEAHQLTTEEIIEHLAESNISAERRVVAKDIETLNHYGYTVEKGKVGKSNSYYVADRKFEFSELAMIADEIRSSKLDVAVKKELIQKLTAFIGAHQAKELMNESTKKYMPQRSNQMIYNANEIAQAIQEKKRLSFMYYAYGADRKKIYRHNGEPYVVNPLATIWNNNNYYLIAYGDKYDNAAKYRIDKMESVKILDEPILEKPQFKDFSVEKFRVREFAMYGGDLQKVTLDLTEDLIDDIYDKFGEETKVIDMGGGKYRVNVDIEVSKTLFTWVVGTLGKVHIVSPESVKTEFNAFIDQIKTTY